MAQSLERPIFLFAGWRTGSTLLQQLLTSHPDVMLWGESRGMLGHLLSARHEIATIGEWSRAQEERSPGNGHPSLVALQNPDPRDLDEGIRRLLLAYYAEPARRAGCSRWGFKEVRHDLSAARYLHHLFPEARFLLLVRHPAACLASARAATRNGRGLLVQAGGPAAFLEHWRRLVRSFLDEASSLPAERILYEELAREPRSHVSRIASFLGVRDDGFDSNVLDGRLRGWKREATLTDEDRRSLDNAALHETAARLGYRPRTAPGVAVTAPRFGAPA